MSEQPKCLHCRQPIRRHGYRDMPPTERYGWVHGDGSVECRSTVATPDNDWIFSNRSDPR